MQATVTGELLAAEAQAALGTPYKQGGRAAGIGLDCIGLVIWVARSAGLGEFDDVAYRQHTVPPPGLLISHLRRKCIEIPIAQRRPGDILVFSIGRRRLHVAMGSTKGRMIHTHSYVGQVVEHCLDERWGKKLFFAFRFPGLVEGE